MSHYAYEAVDSRGRVRRGEIEAPSERDARRALKSSGLIPRRVQSQETVATREGRTTGRGIGALETASFLEQLATLLTAGMPLVDALGSIAEGMESGRGRQIVSALRRQVLEGGALAAALQAQGFDATICNMVAAGEETGRLDAVAARLSELLERRRQWRQDLLSAVLYPLIVTGFGLLVMTFLLTVVVPQVSGVFARAGGHLPWLTQMLIAVSEGLRAYGLHLLIFVVIAVLAYRLALRNKRVRLSRDRLLLALPGLGRLLRKIETARYARTLGMLLAGGVPALAALKIAAPSVSLLPMQQTVAAAQESLREGGSLSDELGRSDYVPHLAVRLIAVGEQSGKLDSMLLRVADIFERDSARQLKRLVTVLEPLLVMLMAVLVGALAMAILLPIMEMNELVR